MIDRQIGSNWFVLIDNKVKEHFELNKNISDVTLEELDILAEDLGLSVNLLKIHPSVIEFELIGEEINIPMLAMPANVFAGHQH